MTWQINLEQTRSGLPIQSLLVIVIRNNSNTGIETSLNFLPSSETFTGNVFSYVCVCVLGVGQCQKFIGRHQSSILLLKMFMI